mmetsp:Transcript_11354/g.26186  ORF Transcript_11354/g.26186 Transcript_11354/m.26186 type:complete len:265 (+) Transcript_11354:469-1263(+)
MPNCNEEESGPDGQHTVQGHASVDIPYQEPIQGCMPNPPEVREAALEMNTLRHVFNCVNAIQQRRSTAEAPQQQQSHPLLGHNEVGDDNGLPERAAKLRSKLVDVVEHPWCEVYEMLGDLPEKCQGHPPTPIQDVTQGCNGASHLVALPHKGIETQDRASCIQQWICHVSHVMQHPIPLQRKGCLRQLSEAYCGLALQTASAAAGGPGISSAAAASALCSRQKRQGTANTSSGEVLQRGSTLSVGADCSVTRLQRLRLDCRIAR